MSMADLLERKEQLLWCVKADSCKISREKLDLISDLRLNGKPGEEKLLESFYRFSCRNNRAPLYVKGCSGYKQEASH